MEMDSFDPLRETYISQSASFSSLVIIVSERNEKVVWKKSGNKSKVEPI